MVPGVFVRGVSPRTCGSVPSRATPNALQEGSEKQQEGGQQVTFSIAPEDMVQVSAYDRDKGEYRSVSWPISLPSELGRFAVSVEQCVKYISL